LCSPADSLCKKSPRVLGAPTASLPEVSGLILAGLVRTRNGFALTYPSFHSIPKGAIQPKN
jgi:hypothetical protein